MEELTNEEQENKKQNKRKQKYPWKSFIKEQIIVLIIGFVFFIAYLIIYLVKRDKPYLYLTIAVPLVALIWVEICALIMVIKENKKNKQTSIDENENEEE
ncbi:hypothetical protein HDR67_02465 [bacterium]|nr:hypothetical protein [bacterium]